MACQDTFNGVQIVIRITGNDIEPSRCICQFEFADGDCEVEAFYQQRNEKEQCAMSCEGERRIEGGHAWKGDHFARRKVTGKTTSVMGRLHGFRQSSFIYAVNHPSLMQEQLYIADPRASYLALRDELDAAIHEVLEGPVYILGTTVERFEEAFAAYVGIAYGVGVNNGTDAIHLALRGLGIGAGDEVITVSHTAVATVAAIRMSGATPVLADVDPASYTIAPEAARKLIGPRTKAIVAVHLYGHPADLDTLRNLCDAHGLKLIEDCAQAHGALYNGRMVGSMGDVSTFSFYPTKNLGAIGDAGMVLCSDSKLAARLKLLRQYGWDTPQHSLIEGWNSRLDPMQAAILQVKLRHLAAFTERRRALAAAYGSALAHLPIVRPMEGPGHRHVYHLYVLRLADRQTREGLRQHMAAVGVMAGIHYALPVHRQQAYAGWIGTGEMTHTEAIADTILSLPLYPELSDADQVRVVEAITSFFSQRP